MDRLEMIRKAQSEPGKVPKLAIAFLELMDYFSGKPHEVMAHCGCSEERAKEILAIAAEWSK